MLWLHELAHSKLSKARSVLSLSVCSLNQLGDHSQRKIPQAYGDEEGSLGSVIDGDQEISLGHTYTSQWGMGIPKVLHTYVQPCRRDTEWGWGGKLLPRIDLLSQFKS